MASEAVKKLLEDLQSQKKFDDGFIKILSDSNDTGEDGKTTASEIVKLIKKRHAENKENKT